MAHTITPRELVDRVRGALQSGRLGYVRAAPGETPQLVWSADGAAVDLSASDKVFYVIRFDKAKLATLSDKVV